MRKWFASLLAVMLLVSLAAVSGAQAPAAINFDVVFAGSTLPADAVASVEALGGKVVGSIPEIGYLKVAGPSTLIKALNGHKSILAASPEVMHFLKPANMVQADVDAVNTAAADLYNAYQWDIKQVTNNGASWELSTGSHGTVVGIVDTGASTQHPALKANLLGGRNYVPVGNDTYNDPGETGDPADIEDRHGHGSHVAGNIAGNGRILGIGPNLGFRAYRVFGAEGGSPSDRIMKAMIDAANDGVDVISMSLGGFDSIAGYTWTDPETGDVYKGKDIAYTIMYKRAVQYAVSKGIVVVAAAGNDAINIANPVEVTAFLNWAYGDYGYYFWGASKEVPGTLPGVVTVSATGPDMSLASYSNYGPGAIDLTAPGGDFQRWPVGDWYLDMNLSACDGLGYCFMAGTSMATPKVSAVAALMIDQAKTNGQKLTPSQVTTKLQQTAVDIGKKGADPYFGYGMVNAYNALGGQ